MGQGDDGTLARIPISDVDAALLENIGTLLVSEVGSITEADTSNVFIFTPVIESDQGKEFFSHYLRTVIVSFVDFGDMLCESVAVPY